MTSALSNLSQEEEERRKIGERRREAKEEKKGEKLYLTAKGKMLLRRSIEKSMRSCKGEINGAP